MSPYNSDRLFGQGLPLGGGNPRPRVLVTPAPGEPPLRGVLLSDDWEGANVHWGGERSRPCTRAILPCSGCREGLPVHWQGFTPFLADGRRAPAILALTDYSAVQLSQLRTRFAGLLGLQVELRRNGNRRNGPTVVRLISDAMRLRFQAVDLRWVRENMLRIWGVNPDQLPPQNADGEGVNDVPS